MVTVRLDFSRNGAQQGRAGWVGAVGPGASGAEVPRLGSGPFSPAVCRTRWGGGPDPSQRSTFPPKERTKLSAQPAWRPFLSPTVASPGSGIWETPPASLLRASPRAFSAHAPSSGASHCCLEGGRGGRGRAADLTLERPASSLQGCVPEVWRAVVWSARQFKDGRTQGDLSPWETFAALFSTSCLCIFPWCSKICILTMLKCRHSPHPVPGLRRCPPRGPCACHTVTMFLLKGHAFDCDSLC